MRRACGGNPAGVGEHAHVFAAPALAVWPDLLIFLTVIAGSLPGDGLRDALDPRAND